MKKPAASPKKFDGENERDRAIKTLQRALANPPPLMAPLTVNDQDLLVATLKSERTGSSKFCAALQLATPRVLARAAKECVIKPSSSCVNRTRFIFLLDHLIEQITNAPKMELSGEGKR